MGLEEQGQPSTAGFVESTNLSAPSLPAASTCRCSFMPSTGRLCVRCCSADAPRRLSAIPCSPSPEGSPAQKSPKVLTGQTAASCSSALVPETAEHHSLKAKHHGDAVAAGGLCLPSACTEGIWGTHPLSGPTGSICCLSAQELHLSQHEISRSSQALRSNSASSQISCPDIWAWDTGRLTLSRSWDAKWLLVGLTSSQPSLRRSSSMAL